MQAQAQRVFILYKRSADRKIRLERVSPVALGRQIIVSWSKSLSMEVDDMKQFLAPLIFALIAIAILCGYLLLIILLPIATWIKIVLAPIYISLVIAMGYVLIRRKRELEREDPDDLSKY